MTFRLWGAYDRALMSKKRLPVHVDPLRAAEVGREMDGVIPLSSMERIVGAVAGIPEGEAVVSLRFTRDVQGLPVITGVVEAELPLECQRCLEVFTYPVKVSIALAMVRSDAEAQALPSHYEPVIVSEEPLFLQELIEDELLLSLPIVPMHDENDCKVQAPEGTGDGVEAEQGGETEKVDNPFAVLAGFKTLSNSDEE